MKIGDVLTIDGKEVIVTYTDGRNFSYAPYEKPVKKTEEGKKRKK